MVERREVLGGVAAVVSLSGCSFLRARPSIEDLFVVNRTDGRVAGSVTLTLENGEVTFEKSFALGSTGTTSYDDPVSEPGQYELAVDLESGRSARHTWWVETGANSRDEGMQVEILPSEIRFDETDR